MWDLAVNAIVHDNQENFCTIQCTFISSSHFFVVQIQKNVETNDRRVVHEVSHGHYNRSQIARAFLGSAIQHGDKLQRLGVETQDENVNRNIAKEFKVYMKNTRGM